MTNQLAPYTDINKFINQSSQTERGGFNTIPSPMKIHLDGKLGAYEKRVYDTDKKELVSEPFPMNWQGTILVPVMHFYQWKFDPSNTKLKFRTREFQEFADTIELLKIDYNAQDKNQRTVVEGSFAGADAFKATYGFYDKLKDKTIYPFELVDSLYIYVHEMDQIVNLQVKGTSRQAFWEYKKDYRVMDHIKSMVQIKTEFGCSELQKNNAGAEYYSVLFKTIAQNSDEEMQKIMEMSNNLNRWRESFNVNRVQVEVAVASEPKPLTEALKPYEQDHEEIDVSTIPF